ncbi:MAG: deoxyribose-phosphate aldolase [Bdellovibrionales bacterium]|nr:deoxyribose-phosphate aldolase [Bdellovibrionales bacterium]
MGLLNEESFVKLVDHTLLSPLATEADIHQLCAETLKHNFFAVCIQPFHVRNAVQALKGSSVKVATVVNFPLANQIFSAVAHETECVLSLGADEVDMVLRLSSVKSGDWGLVKEEVLKLKEICGSRVLKVILETGSLSVEEKVRACQICDEAGADFVKTSTGFAGTGATIEDVVLMKKHFPRGIKASGGIRNLRTAEEMVSSGATRLGLSGSLDILRALRERET